MRPWLYLLDHLPFHPTFPFVMGALQEERLLPDTGDTYEDGLLLFRDILKADILDERRKSIALELCGGIKVPVMHVRDRSVALYARSVLPDRGPSRGRLCVQDLVERERVSDIETLYGRLYDNPKFGHAVALGERRLSRDPEMRRWVHHEDTVEFEDALNVLRECDEDLVPITD